MKTHRMFIVAPVASGKTTFADGKHYFDSDQARRPEDEPKLKKLRRARDWAEHNEIWHRALRKWAERSVPVRAVILTHSYADARAMGAERSDTVVVLPPVDVLTARYRQRNLVGDDLNVAIHNYQTVVKEALHHQLATASSIEAAARVLQIASAGRAANDNGGAR